jgi:hypothetical protein
VHASDDVKDQGKPLIGIGFSHQRENLACKPSL